METRRKMKLSTSDKVLLGFGYAVLGIFVLAILIPLVYVVVASFMDPNVLNSQGISFKFKDWTLDAYRRVSDTYIYSGESAPYGKYGLGDFASGSIQCMEYDFGENVLSVYSKRTSRSVSY